MVYDHIVSLGGDCTTAAQMKRVAPGYAGSPYDWLVTPWTALCASLEDQGKHYASSVIVKPDGTIRCGTYGMGFVHEFTRHPEGGLNIDVESLAACRSKLTYKHEQMLQKARSGRTLFVRYRAFTDMDKLAERNLTAMDLDRLASALANTTARDDFVLLLIVPEGFHISRDIGENVSDELSSSRVRIARIQVDRDDPILGSDRKFDRIFGPAVDQ